MRTRILILQLSVLCAGSMLSACTGFSQHAATDELAARVADDAYLRGRNHYLARRYDDAMRSYETALAAEPSHVNARNGLATLYAERREFKRAIAIWRGLTEQTSLASGTGAAFLFNNLGYAYFLDGDYANAKAALEKACLLDPLSHRAWQNLGETLQQLGENERAQQMMRQASALREPEAGASKAVPAEAPANGALAQAPDAGQQEWPVTELRPALDGTLELRIIQAAHPAADPAVPAPVPAPAAEVVPVRDVALLEIRNGNGVTGMAKSLARQMGDPGLKVVRLTNEKGFKVQQTRVEYQGQFLPAAQRLAERFGNAKMVEVDSVKGVNMRLIIGRDLVRTRFVLRPMAQPTKLADTTPADKTGG
ncbi:LytR C-terminal domain-containing protein [Massilia horti]|uniref:Tetratricopeptide repeat protein n=1 Tax=Massilia horti TaxID=2562153 RepID=A0A4Y9SSG5_9BURK|nr:LytR C-terminal domain-containing protein [Massilia horti]TFW29732.1 tetratricopeptide repeat protein [Massilia horti]